MEKLTKEIDSILTERFGKDSIIVLATAADNIPYVRSVDAFYENGAFYILTHGLSGKMKQIKDNPVVALSGEWLPHRVKVLIWVISGKKKMHILPIK